MHTPAQDDNDFNHIPVLLDECIEALNIKSDGIYVDATFGGGGHSRAMLERLGKKGRLIAFDHDKDAWQNAIDDQRFLLVKENFRYIRQFLIYYGLPKVDGILADIGVSSHQFDTAERGFSTRFDAYLDMRMDDRLQLTAADILNQYDEKRLHKVLEQYGQVRNAKTLASLLVERRKTHAFRTINDFKKAIEPLVKGNPNKYLAQVFQALRIEVNEELQVLQDFLKAAIQCLKKEGRLAVITFHSLEDKIVKQFMKSGGREEIVKDVFGRETSEQLIKMIGDITPGQEELKRNTRSRSARLRVASKL